MSFAIFEKVFDHGDENDDGERQEDGGSAFRDGDDGDCLQDADEEEVD